MIRYARKSIGQAKNANQNIQKMVDNLYNRSKVDKCYVFYSSNASNDIESKNIKDNVETLATLKNIHGNTQGIICVYLHVKLNVLISLFFYRHDKCYTLI